MYTAVCCSARDAVDQVFDFAATKLLRVAATINQGGDALVYMATSSDLEDAPAGGFYATEVTDNFNH
jgi:hypothetical protein